ncbi:MAG: xanthine dehydrogenase family protein subunit M [Anaerolineaceae bacterium]|nr:xanthine dehydrogenase family protein subunit M [Anaerolineaceae bacterium]MCB9102353.1 xanthine dehydrogenase family protein subunit M [Anaerolineales bacterium]
MYPAKFDYYRAASVQEAIQLLQDHEDAKLMAGGHSLIPAMKLRLAQPPAIIDIGRIAELKGVSQDNGSIKVGALTVHADVAASDVLQANCPLLAEAAGNVGDRQVRHKGTIGGNLAHADPASDMPAAVLALGGTIHLMGPGGARQVAAADFFLDLLATDLHEDEVLTAIEVPALSGKTGTSYLKFEHPASGYAVCGAAAVVTLNDDGTCASASLCFNGVTATPHNASAVTAALAGQTLDDATIDQAVDANLSISDPMGDMHASGPYRIELAKTFAKRALKMARDRA